MKTSFNPLSKPRLLSNFKPVIIDGKPTISFWEFMELVHAEPIASLHVYVERYKHETNWRKGAVLSKARAEAIFNHLKHYKGMWFDLGWHDIDYRLDLLLKILEWRNDVGAHKPKLSAEKLTPLVYNALDELGMAISMTVDEYQFILIDKSKRHLVEQDELFGKSVALAFPSSKEDIKEACYCLAVGIYTGAVFYLMRIAERGMRSLAIHLNSKGYKNEEGKKPSYLSQMRYIFDARRSGKIQTYSAGLCYVGTGVECPRSKNQSLEGKIKRIKKIVRARIL